MLKKGKIPTGTIKVVSYLLILLPAALGFLYVHSFGINVVAQDSWAMVPLFVKLSSGTIGVSDLVALHAEHRILFPRIAMLLLGTLTQYNSVAEMYLIQSCLLVILISLLFAFKDNVISKRSLLFPISFLPIAFLVFSLRQYENMLTGFQIAFVFVELFSVLSLYFLYVSSRHVSSGRKGFRKVAFLAALGSGTVATFSAVQGLFVWPVGLLQLLISPVEKPAKKWLVGVWGLVGAGNWIVYFIGYTNPPQNPSLLYVLEHPRIGIELFLTLLGGSLFGTLGSQNFLLVGQQSFAPAIGLLLICLVVASLLLIYRDGKWGENSFWIALLLFSFLVIASIAVGRAEVWIGDVASRYTNFAILSIIGVYAILAKQAFAKKSYLTTGLLGTLSVLVLLSVPVSYTEGVEVGRALKVERENAALTLSTYESQPDALLAEVHRRPTQEITEGGRLLKSLGYNVFSEP